MYSYVFLPPSSFIITPFIIFLLAHAYIYPFYFMKGMVFLKGKLYQRSLYPFLFNFSYYSKYFFQMTLFLKHSLNIIELSRFN